MSTRRGYPTPELQAENDRLAEMYLNQNKLSLEQVIEKYASDSFKEYLNRPIDDEEIIEF